MKQLDLVLTALAPAVWGSTYYITTEFLPSGYPLTQAMLRALPAGLLLLAITRQLPPRQWLGRVLLLGAFNFAIFWVLLFVTAYRLPGGPAATLGAMQALFVILLARAFLGRAIHAIPVIAALVGVVGVAMMVLGPAISLDPIGLIAGLGGAASMAAGTVLTRKWQPPVSNLTFTAWQLTAGGLIQLPIALLFEPPMPIADIRPVAGMAYLSIIGAAVSYWLWFRGVARIEPSSVSMLGLMSPISAMIIGWLLLDQSLTAIQLAGAALVIGSVLLAQWTGFSRPNIQTREATS